MQSVKTARGKTAIRSKPRDIKPWLRVLILWRYPGGVWTDRVQRVRELGRWGSDLRQPEHQSADVERIGQALEPVRSFQYPDVRSAGLHDVVGHRALAQLDPNSTDMLDASLNPYIFHIASLLVHWVTACVVMEILLRIGFGKWPAAMGAILFAIHPLQTEAVAWATAMKDLLSGMFVMLAIWRYLAAMEFTGKRRWIHYGIATFFFLCALLSKPSTVITPLILVVLDLVVFQRAWRGVLGRLWPWFLMALVATLLAESIQSTRPLTYTPILYRPLIAADALAFYLSKLVLPMGLTWDYGRTPVAVLHDARLHHPLYWTWIFPAALAVLIWRVKRPQIRAAGLVFLAGLLPVLGLTSFVFQYYSTVADRYIYVAMLGVAMAVAWVISSYGNRMVIGGFLVVATLLCCVSFTQAGYWKDHEVLSTREEDLGVGNALHYIVLGQYKDRLAQVALSAGDMRWRRGAVRKGNGLSRRVRPMRAAPSRHFMMRSRSIRWIHSRWGIFRWRMNISGWSSSRWGIFRMRSI